MTAKARSKTKRRAAPRSRPVKSRPAAADDAQCCTLCGYESDGSFADRVRHLRRSHPGYARGLLLRLAAPLVFAGLVVLLAVIGAPTVAYLIALAITAGCVAAGIAASRRDPSRTSARPSLRQLLGNGGFRFLIFGAAALIMVLLTFH